MLRHTHGDECVTSLAFSLWHVSAVTLHPDFDLPGAQIPVFLANAAVLGAIGGVLRWLSESVIVASLTMACGMA
jgi:membrane protease YdiL (CAAX protease family)